MWQWRERIKSAAAKGAGNISSTLVTDRNSAASVEHFEVEVAGAEVEKLALALQKLVVVLDVLVVATAGDGVLQVFHGLFEVRFCA